MIPVCFCLASSLNILTPSCSSQNSSFEFCDVLKVLVSKLYRSDVENCTYFENSLAVQVPFERILYHTSLLISHNRARIWNKSYGKLEAEWGLLQYQSVFVG